MPKFTCDDGAKLFFNVVGKGCPIVLISGGFCDHRVWDDIVELLSQTYQVICYDHRGIGESDVSEREYTVKLLANDLYALLTHLKIQSAHIVGHSMGGFIAQFFSAHYPEKVLSLSLLSSLLMMNEAGHEYLNSVINAVTNDPDKLRQAMPELAGQLQATQSILQQVILCKQHDARSYIDKISAPTLIISGIKEPVVTKEASQILASAITSVKRMSLLNSGHLLQREVPKEVAKGYDLELM